MRAIKRTHIIKKSDQTKGSNQNKTHKKKANEERSTKHAIELGKMAHARCQNFKMRYRCLALFALLYSALFSSILAPQFFVGKFVTAQIKKYMTQKEIGRILLSLEKAMIPLSIWFYDVINLSLPLFLFSLSLSFIRSFIHFLFPLQLSPSFSSICTSFLFLRIVFQFFY